MGKRKQIKESYTTKILGFTVAIFLCLSVGNFIFGLIKSSSEGSSVSANKVWCSNCQTYHDKETAAQEEQKLIWCANCNQYHEPRDESK